MRLKLIALFLAIQLLSFGLWQRTFSSEPVAEIPLAVADHAVAEEITSSDVRVSVRNFTSSQRELNNARKIQLQNILAKLPARHTESLEKVILDYDRSVNRGLGGGNMIILRAIALSQAEFAAVFVHEIGHVVDLGYLKETNENTLSTFEDFGRPVYLTDPSLDFYRISWLDDKTRKSAANNLDFVSGYAMTDPFEDFAESYVYYVLHGNDFKVMAQSSPALMAKYLFMRDHVFDGQEFGMDDGKLDNVNRRVWDITKLAYDLDEFLN